MGCHSLLQEIFPTQGSNPGLLHCRWRLYHLSHQGSPISDQLCANENFSEILFYIRSPGKIKIVRCVCKGVNQQEFLPTAVGSENVLVFYCKVEYFYILLAIKSYRFSCMHTPGHSLGCFQYFSKSK